MKDKKINVLFLVHSFEIGGVQIINNQLISNIDSEKFNVYVLYIKEGSLLPDKSKVKLLKKMGNTINMKTPKNIFYMYKITKIIRTYNIDIVHSIDPVSYILGSISAKINKVKHIRVQPNLLENETLNFKTFKFTPFEKWTNKFIVLNKASYSSLKDAGVNSRKIELLYGFTELPTYETVNRANIRDELNISSSDELVITIHRLVENKGLEVYIEMIPFIIEYIKNVKFLIIGDGPLRKKLEERVKELNVESYVYFTGMRDDTIEISRQCSLGVYPRGKTAGMINTLRAGKLIITLKKSLMAEYIVSDNQDILATHDKPEEYARIVTMLLKNKKNKKNKERLQEDFVKKNLDGKLNLKVFEKLLEMMVADEV